MIADACPFPVTGNGPDGQPLVCYVIEGSISVFGFGDLSWVDPIVQDSLNEAMGAGEFDNGVIDESVIYTRFVPLDTVLNVTTDESNGGQTKSGGGTPAWAWVLIALGIFGLILSLIYLTLKRRKQQEEFDRMQQEAEFFTGEKSGEENEDSDEGDSENAQDRYSDEDEEINSGGEGSIGSGAGDEYDIDQVAPARSSMRASSSSRPGEGSFNSGGGSFRFNDSRRSGGSTRNSGVVVDA